MTTALLVLAIGITSLGLLGHTVLRVFRDTPAPRTAPPSTHEPDSSAPPWDLAA